MPRASAAERRESAVEERKDDGRKEPTATSEASSTEEKKPDVWNRSPSQIEVALSDDILRDLRDRAQEMGAEATIDGLIKVLDVHPMFRMPTDWPGDKEAVLCESELLGEIGRIMLRGCAKLEISPRSVIFLWKNQKSWTQRGQPVMCQPRSLGEIPRFLSEGAKAAVIGNFQLFRYLNTRQKLAALYNALRALDVEGSLRPNQFEGFFDSLELFGTGTFQTDAMLRRAMDHGAQRELPFDQPVDVTASTDPDSKDDNGDEGHEE